MFAGMLRELRYLQRHKADLFMAVIAPLLVIVLFASMFSSGKADHLPIAIIDQDQSEMSRKVIHALSINHTLKVKTITASQDEAERLVNSTEVWGSLLPFGILIIFSALYFALSIRLLRKNTQEQRS